MALYFWSSKAFQPYDPWTERDSVSLMSRRTDQIASLIHRAVQSLISRGLNDPRVRGLVSVTKVSVPADMSKADVFVSVFPAEHAALTLRGLIHAAAHIQREVGRTVRLRRQPHLVFKLDDAMTQASETMAAITVLRDHDQALQVPSQVEESSS